MDGRIRALGEPAGVIQLLDRHTRDSAAFAARFGDAVAHGPGCYPECRSSSCPCFAVAGGARSRSGGRNDVCSSARTRWGRFRSFARGTSRRACTRSCGCGRRGRCGVLASSGCSSGTAKGWTVARQRPRSRRRCGSRVAGCPAGWPARRGSSAPAGSGHTTALLSLRAHARDAHHPPPPSLGGGTIDAQDSQVCHGHANPLCQSLPNSARAGQQARANEVRRRLQARFAHWRVGRFRSRAAVNGLRADLAVRPHRGSCADAGCGRSPGSASPSPAGELLPVLGAGGARDRLVHQRSAEVVDAGTERSAHSPRSTSPTRPGCS